MRRGRILLFVVLIVVIGLIVAFVAIRQLLLSAGSNQTPQFVQIYIAGQNIPQGTKISEEQLSTMQIPQADLVAVEFTTDELPNLLSKVAKYPIDQGVPITESTVSDASNAVPISGPQWASLIPAGQTAVSIPIDRHGLSAYAVNDGAHVNVTACFLFVDIDPAFQAALPNLAATLTGTGFTPDGLPILSLGVAGAGGTQGRLELDPSVQQPYYLIPSEAQRPRMVCQILLQDVVVMKVGSFPLDASTNITAPAAPAQPGQPSAPVVAPDLVTLLVSPQDSITLTYLSFSDARITLTLRNPSDQARQATEASTLQFLLSQYNIPVPAKLPYSLEPTIVDLHAPLATAVTNTPAP